MRIQYWLGQWDLKVEGGVVHLLSMVVALQKCAQFTATHDNANVANPNPNPIRIEKSSNLLNSYRNMYVTY